MDTISVYNPITNLTCVHKVSKFGIFNQSKKELLSYMHYKTSEHMIPESMIHRIAMDRYKQIPDHEKKRGRIVTSYWYIQNIVHAELIGGEIKKESEISPVIRDMERLKEIQLEAIKGAEEAKKIAEKYKKPFFKLFD